MRISDWSSDVCSSDLEPADHVGGTGLAQQDLADLLQHRIAGSMAIAIVDGLEVVHIEVEHRAGSAVAFLESGHAAELARSEERRVGKECVSTCRSRWSPVL